MRQFAFILFFIFSFSVLPLYAMEVPEKYSAKISAVDFYPSGAKFTFMIHPQGNGGDFTAVLPGSFRADSIRLANPESVYGNIFTASYPRTRWIPTQLESLKRQRDEQSKIVDDLNARKVSLEQTLNLLKNYAPDKANPNDILNFVKEAQNVRLETENELSRIKVALSEEQEKFRMLNAELSSKTPGGAEVFTVITGRAKGTVYIEAFTNAASWSPKYILDLSPESGSVDVKMFIRASQKTGLDYSGGITLHTKNPDERVTVPEVSPLRVGIKPKEEVVARMSGMSLSRTNKQFRSARMAMNEAAMYMEDADTFAEDEEPEAPKAPAVRETLADRTLDIDGTLTGDGTERDFEVRTSGFHLAGKTEITLIPEQRNDAWIIAEMDESNETLIPGEAELRVDGHISGKIYLDEYGKSQKRIPFGYANQITAKKEALVEKTGVSWFSGVFTSGYKLEITNGTKTDQVITVKDRLPVPTDEKIKLDVKRIEPKEKSRDRENRLTWEITVPAGATVPVIVDYTLSYPSGEELQYK